MRHSISEFQNEELKIWKFSAVSSILVNNPFKSSLTLSAPSCFWGEKKKIKKFFLMNFYSKESFYAREISLDVFCFFFFKPNDNFFTYNHENK